MEYVRVTSIEDPKFAAMHRWMCLVFPPEEVMAYELWREPIENPDIHVYVALHNGEVVGATEYRYYPELRVAMTDFTIIGMTGQGIGRFLYVQMAQDLQRLQQQTGTVSIGMFAEIYRPHSVFSFNFGSVLPMHPVVRREVMSHMGYRKIDLSYVHPSWGNECKAVTELDLGFLPSDEAIHTLSSNLIVQFLSQYYAASPNKPKEWLDMISFLDNQEDIKLLPL